MEGVIAPPFVRALEAGRERFNARFAQARRAFPRLEGQVFLDLLRRRVDPVLQAIAERDEGQVAAATDVLYDVTLELLGKGMLGQTARQPDFERLWTEALTGTAVLIARQPGELIGRLSNALYNLLTTSGCRAAEWCQQMAGLASDVPDADTFLKLGMVAAWRCGMAHFRTAALELARKLPPAAVARILLPPMSNTAQLLAAVERLEADPWFNPSNPNPPPGPRLVAEVGGFRGFGGGFRSPPTVFASAGHLYAGDGESTWLLTADAFGAVFHRLHPPEKAGTGNGRLRLDRVGTVWGTRGEAAFPVLAWASSSASTETTLAVTLPHSHRVFLISEGVE
ncbi:MAG TPA: hypothetical protein VKE74_07320 [Gemmataceae bacterium]|nr:hypothetical protein [Gemmataceae bacterium]